MSPLSKRLNRAWFLCMLTPPNMISGFGSSVFLPTVTGTINNIYKLVYFTYNKSFQSTNVVTIRGPRLNWLNVGPFYFLFSSSLRFNVLSLDQFSLIAATWIQNFLYHQFTALRGPSTQLYLKQNPFLSPQC